MSECRFCRTALNFEDIEKAAEKERLEARAYRLGNSKKHLLAGLGIFMAWLFLTVSGYLGGSSFGGNSFIFIGLLFGGLAELGNGFYGLLDYWGINNCLI